MRRVLCRLVPWALTAALGLSAPAGAQTPDWLNDVGYDQRLGAQLPLDTMFVDSGGEAVRLADLFGERPVVLVFVYYECPMLCSQVLAGLVRSLRAISYDVGADFDVIALSIDPGETSAMGARQKAGWVERYGREESAPGWHFLTGKEEDIRRVTDTAGFRYVYDAETDEYAHAAGLVVATPSGELSRYFFDVEFPARDLQLALVEASDGRIGDLIDQLLLFCFHYDPSQGAYTLAVWSVMRVFGLLTLAVLLGFVLRSIVRERRSRVGLTERAALAEGPRP